MYAGHMYLGEPDGKSAGGMLFKFNVKTGETKILMSKSAGIEADRARGGEHVLLDERAEPCRVHAVVHERELVAVGRQDTLGDSVLNAYNALNGNGMRFEKVSHPQAGLRAADGVVAAGAWREALAAL